MNTLERLKDLSPLERLKELYAVRYRSLEDSLRWENEIEKYWQEIVDVIDAAKVVLIEAYYERGPNKVWEECHDDLKKAIAALEGE